VDRRQFLVGAASLAAAPRGLAGGARAVALVTADLESHVVAFDLAASRVIRRIPTPAFPRSIESVGRVAVVAHADTGVVSIVDGRRVRHVLRGFGEPRYAAAHPDGRHAYLTDATRGQVVMLDVLRGRVVARTAVGRGARHISLDAGTSALWVALGTKAHELVALELAESGRPRVVGRLSPSFLAHDVGFAPDAAHVWVTSADRNEIAIHSPDGKLVTTVAGDWPPQHVSFHAGRAYVTSGWSGTLNVHTTDGRHLGRSVVPVGSYNVQYGAGRVVSGALGRGTLTVCDTDGSVTAERGVARSSHDACVLAL
jgi:DNA-binding beta-propeller fold protein YncE